jgi:hypothetical protein
MKGFATLLALTLAVLGPMAPSPAEAYDVFLTQWNVTELNSAGDEVKVTISGSTITFLWVDGDSTPPSGSNLLTIAWSSEVHAAGGTATSPGYTVDATANKNADGFGKFLVHAQDDGGTDLTSVTFTFASNLNATAFTSSHFALHVDYVTDTCSGWVSGGETNDLHSEAGCTPVPEPITMFLGGTGLLTLGYAARKRLFGGQKS